MHCKTLLLTLILTVSCSVDYALHQAKNEQKKSKSSCQTNKDCPKDHICSKPQLDNCQDDINCQIYRLRNDMKTKCRLKCSPTNEKNKCQTGQRCLLDKQAKSYICLPGTCDSNSDCGKNGNLENTCLDATNGPKSGICALSCNPLNCIEGSCHDCTLTADACEFNPENKAFLCVPGGSATSFEPCDPERLFCAPGHICYGGLCLPFCNPQTSKDVCPILTKCVPLTPGSHVGACLPNQTSKG